MTTVIGNSHTPLGKKKKSPLVCFNGEATPKEPKVLSSTQRYDRGAETVHISEELISPGPPHS